MAETDAIIIPGRRHDPVLGSLAGQAGYLGARLGWYGWHGPVASSGPLVDFDDVGTLETVS
jgi:hypothetical protein